MMMMMMMMMMTATNGSKGKQKKREKEMHSVLWVALLDLPLCIPATSRTKKKEEK